ncbi:hypothetical protein [Idiomarina sp.]|uniref:hypothetical protein n=1 Tax=Idiomarina sp. TaxID=1874361 RepID=UPI003A91F401
MKLNYFTYTIKFKKKGERRKVCVKDVIDTFCTYQKNENCLVKTNDKTDKELYFAKAGQYNSIFYLMTPTDLHQYRTLDKSSGRINHLSTVIGGDSLEKVTYIFIDKSRPIVGIASSQGGANFEDLQFYLNEVLNGLTSDELYEISLEPLISEISRSEVKSLAMISQADIILDSRSSQMTKLKKFLTNGKVANNLEIEISFKRTNTGDKGIEDDIKPLLNLLESDTNSSEFARAHFRGKRNSLAENIKDMYLDHSLVIYDVIYPKLKTTIEHQIEEKRSKNQSVNSICDSYFNSMTTKLHSGPVCDKWSMLTNSGSY